MKRIILSFLTVLTLAVAPAALVHGTAYAACSGGSGSSKDQVIDGIDQTGNTDCTGTGVLDIIGTVVDIFSLVVGVAAIFMIINGGFKYITSGGEASKVANAKNTFIYALVGLAIAVLAQFIVHFVVQQADSTVNCPAGQHKNAAGKCEK